MSWSHRRRFLTAVELGEPDVVPITDLSMDPPLVEKITGIQTHGFSLFGFHAKDVDTWEISMKNYVAKVKAYKKVEFDAMIVDDITLFPHGYFPKFLDEHTFIDEWGRMMKNRSDTKTTWWVGGTVKTPEDLEQYYPPDAGDPGRMELTEAVIKDVGEEMAVMGETLTAFTLAWQVRGGIDKLIIDMYTNPTFVRKLMDKVGKAALEYAKLMMDAGVDVLVLGGDYADTHGPLIHPKLLREFELPYLKSFINEAKRRGVPLLKHSDGNLYLILDEMVNTGISGLHPMEPGAMDIGDVKERYGDRIFLMGNVDCRYVLSYGSEEDVRKDVRRCIDAASRGGGYILSSSNSLHANVKAENVLIMVDEAKKYGRYPISKKHTRR